MNDIKCIGVIIDGNRRWAKERGLPPMRGHEAGYKKFKEFLDWAREADVRHVIAYVFSAENWNRSNFQNIRAEHQAHTLEKAYVAGRHLPSNRHG